MTTGQRHIRRVAVFGAGNFGRRLARALEASEIEVACIIDRHEHREIPEFTYCHILNFTESIPVVLGVHNPDADLKRIVEDLRLVGVVDVLSPPQVLDLLRHRSVQLTNYWLSSDFDYRDYAEEISASRALLQDDESRSCFDRVLSYRLDGSVANSKPEHDLSEQYLPEDIPFLTRDMRWADVGAFDGDTVRSLRSTCPDRVDAVFAFEPDLDNYSRAIAQLQDWPGLSWQAAPLAAWDSAEQLRFEASGAASAAITASGTNTVQAVALDDLLLEWHPSHIKMDIEGAELHALRGLLQTIIRNRPRLAIAAYHEPTHHWALIQWLASLDLGYRFWMRNYAHQTFDVVLYAVAE